MSNCLFEAAYEEILHRCNCTPSFHLVAYEEYPSICSGHKLTCMSKILTEIGKFNQVSQGHAREDMLERTCQRGHGRDMLDMLERIITLACLWAWVIRCSKI